MLSIRVAGSPVDGGWQGALTLAGTLAGQPLAGTATRSRMPTAFAFRPSTSPCAENRITGALAAEDGGPFLRHRSTSPRRTSARSPLVASSRRPVPPPRATFTPENGRQGIAATSRPVTFRSRGVTVASAEGEARIDDASAPLS
jgi:hypothetical protein